MSPQKQKIELSKVDLDRLKRDAKSRSKTDQVSYCEALNLIAREYGFQTYENLKDAVRNHKASPPDPVAQEDEDAGREKILAWFRSRFTLIDNYSARVSPRISKSLMDFECASGRSALVPVDIGLEIDFGYEYQPYRHTRHPGALAAEEILESEGVWVANAFLDSLRVLKGGYLLGDSDRVVGHRISIIAADEE